MIPPIIRYFGALLTLGGLLFLLGNSGGAAASNNFYTGAPTAAGGVESTCNTCHVGGGFGEPQLAVTLSLRDNAMGEVPVGRYVPGAVHTVTVAVGYNDQAPAGYGFQAQVLSAREFSTTGTLAEPGVNSRITAASNGRTYAEHRRRAPDSLFTFEWTAPAAGTDSVKMYVVGNLVNGAAGTGGDNGSSRPLVLSLTEGMAVGTRSLTALPGGIFPNPGAGPATLRVTPARAGDYELSLRAPDGRLLARSRHFLGTGTEWLPLPVAGLRPGLYLVELRGARERFVGRLLRR